MNTLKLYSLKDTVTGLFSAPLGFINDSAAKRGIAASSAQIQHFTDMAIYLIAELSLECGEVDAPKSPIFLCNCVDLIKEGDHE